MPTYTQDVAAVSDPDTSWTPAGTPVSNLNDDSTGTNYSTATVGSETADYLELSFVAPSLTGERIRSIRAEVSWLDSTATAKVAAAIYLDGVNVGNPLTAIQDDALQTQEAVIAAPTLGHKVLNGADYAWDEADVADFRIRIWNVAGVSLAITKADLIIETSTDPTLTVASVLGLDSAYPKINFSFDDPDTGVIDQPSYVDLHVYNDGTEDPNGVAAGDAGFDPELVSSDVPDIIATNAFPDSVGPLSIATYHAYARAAKNLTIAGRGHYSPWVHQQLDVTVVLSSAPAITVTADDTLDRFDVVVDVPPPNLLTAEASKTESLDPFSASTDWTLGLDSVGALRGLFSLHARANNTSASVVSLLQTGYVAAEAGKAYSASVKIEGPAKDWQIGISFAASLDGPFGNWGAVTYGTATAVNNSSFTEVKVENVTAPAGTQFAAIQIKAISPTASQQWQIDEFQIHEGATIAAWDTGAAPAVGESVPGSAVDVQRSFDAGVTWSTFATGIVTFTATQATVIDREVASGQLVRYRARINRVTAISSYGSDDTDRSVTITKLWIRHPTEPAKDVEANPILADHAIVQPFKVLEPIGSDRAVVLRGRARGDVGKLRVRISTDTDRENLRSIASAGDRVVIQDNLGNIWPAQLTAQPKLRQLRRQEGGVLVSVYEATLEWREVA